MVECSEMMFGFSRAPFTKLIYIYCPKPILYQCNDIHNLPKQSQKCLETLMQTPNDSPIIFYI